MEGLKGAKWSRGERGGMRGGTRGFRKGCWAGEGWVRAVHVKVASGGG